MSVRILIAGLLGAVAMFAWATLAHTVLPLGNIGISTPPSDAITASLHTELGAKPGLYMFPAFDMHAPDQAKSMAAYEEKLKTMPQGIIVYKPAGNPPMEVKMFVGEFLLELAEALLAAWLLTRTAITSLAGRVGFVGVVGLVAAITTNGSYWNWYGFPLSYTLSYAFTELMGFIVAGVVIALVMGKKAAA